MATTVFTVTAVTPVALSTILSILRCTSASTGFNLQTRLPSDWNSICDVDYDASDDVNATIRCHITAQDHVLLRFADLKAVLKALESTELKVSVNLQCATGGTISLPILLNAPGLVKLTVFNCRLLDMYADVNTFLQHEPPSNSLRVLDMRNCVWLEDLTNQFALMLSMNNTFAEYLCLQSKNLVSQVNRNITNLNRGDLILRSAFQNLNMTYPDDLGLIQSEENFTRFVDSMEEMGGMFRSLADELTHYRSSGRFNIIERLMTLKTTCVFEHLEMLDLSHSPPLQVSIPTLNPLFFLILNFHAQFPELKTLNCSYLGLRKTPREILEWGTHYRHFPGAKSAVVDLSHNEIHQADIIPYRGRVSPHLNTTLNLQFNNITKIPLQLFQALASMPGLDVDIRNNPISCACALTELVTQLHNKTLWAGSAMMYYKRHLSVMECATPPELSGRVITSLSVRDLNCYVDKSQAADLLSVMAALVAVVLVLLVLFVLAVVYREEVRILLFTRVHLVLPCSRPKKQPGDAPEKVYDAFVAHAHQDSHWVLNSLLKRLEEPGISRGCGSVKLCIHQRDFIVGKPIIDNIIDCIAASRHTIIVISKSFVKSAWAMEELHHAYRQSMEERRRHLVLVVLEDVAQSDMEPVLRRCCKTFTYLHVNDSLFWDRLQYSIHNTDCGNGGGKKAMDKNSMTTSSASEDSSKDYMLLGVADDNCTFETNHVPETSIEDVALVKTAVFKETMRMCQFSMYVCRDKTLL